MRRRVWAAGWAAFNACRIEAGRPLFGIDFEGAPPASAYPGRKQREDESGQASGPGVLPAETGLLSRAVSFTKGCYLGQEVVARMHARGQVARQLVGIKMDDNALPIAGASIFDASQNTIGGITSSTPAPMLSCATIALGLVKTPFIPPGTKPT